MLPEETIVAEPFAVEAFGVDGAMFVGEPDPETNFKLFGPLPSSATGSFRAIAAAMPARTAATLPSRIRMSAMGGILTSPP